MNTQNFLAIIGGFIFGCLVVYFAMLLKQEKQPIHICPQYPNDLRGKWLDIRWFKGDGADTLTDKQAMQIALKVAVEVNGTVYIPNK